MKNLDLKTIAILIIAIILLLTILFKGTSNKIAFDLDKLHKVNDSLVKENTILKKERDSIDIHVKYLEDLADEKTKEINKATDKINKLNKSKNEISNYIDTMSNDSIANAFTKYLERRKG